MRPIEIVFPALLCAALAACGANRDLQPGDVPTADMGVVRAALTNVPAGVRCLRVSRAGGESGVVVSLPLTAGAATQSLDLGQLPAGALTLVAEAFPQTCRPNFTLAATWISEPAAVSVVAGAITHVSLFLYPVATATATADFGVRATQLALGSYATFALMEDGTVRGWGAAGLTGHADAGDVLLPTTIPGLTNVREISAGSSHACARLGDGSVLCWGSNEYGQLGAGAVDDEFPVRSATPLAVAGLANVTQISLGDAHSCALTASGDAYCWGYNLDGRALGYGTTNVFTPTGVLISGPPLAELRASAGGVCARRYSSAIFCWGPNYNSGRHGQFGGFGAVRLLTGYYVDCAARADGAILCWGPNFLEGDPGQPASFAEPTRMPWTDTQDLFSTYDHWCRLTTAGAVQCRGANTYGQAGVGHAERVHDAVGLFPADVVEIAGRTWHTCARTTSGGVFCSGENSSGALGDGTREWRFAPVRVRF